MFESVFESKSQLLKGKKPGGAILAHCMGLGKTLQNITLIHTIMTNFPEVSIFLKSKGYEGIWEKDIPTSVEICRRGIIFEWILEFILMQRWLDPTQYNEPDLNKSQKAGSKTPTSSKVIP